LLYKDNSFFHSIIGIPEFPSDCCLSLIASFTQDFYDGKKDIEDMTPEELGDYYLSL